MQGEIIPFPFGYAYHEWDRDAILYVWIPFNKLVTLWMRFMIWIRFKKWDEALSAAYRAGYSNGYKQWDGYNAAWKESKK